LAGVGTRYFAQYSASKDAPLQAFDSWYRRRSMMVSPIAALLAVVVAYWFSEATSLVDLLLIAWWAAANGAWAAAVARLQGLQRFHMVALGNGLYMALALGGIAVSSSTSSRHEIMLVFAVAATLVGVACFANPGGSRDRSSDGVVRFSAAAIRPYGLNMWLTALISGLVWSRAELTVIRGSLSAADVAVYGCAITLSSLATTGMALLTGALGPRLAALWAGQEVQTMARISREITDWLLLASTLGIAVIIAFPVEIIGLAFGPGYGAAGVPLVFLALGAFGLTSGCVATLAQYQSNGRFSRDVNLLGASLLFAAAAILVKIEGVTGVALGRCVAQLVVGAIAYRYCSRHVSRNSFRRANVAWGFGILFALSTVSIFAGAGGLAERMVAFAGAIGLCAVTLRMGPANEPSIKFVQARVRAILMPRSTG
jgi:O-antigen/teichoic acid export membrane protein